MAVTYSTATKQARMSAVIAQIDAGSGNGRLKIRDASNNVLVTFVFDKPCGTASGGVLTFDTTPALTATATASGTATNAIITDSADNVVVSGLTVGTSGADIILDNVSINSGQVCTLTSGTITHAP